MYFVRSTPIIVTLLLIITLIEVKSTYRSLSSGNIKDLIKYFLNLTGVENEYARFLNFLHIYPSTDNVKKRAFYDELFSINAYLSDLTRSYAKYYTSDEINELIIFYSSSVDQKLIQANSELNRQMEDITLSKISDYIFTSSEHGFSIPL
ncbi:unnamed protein product [Rotaria magnacalcarata]|uniref:DUF2059 domain-containing protein n=1 Tax=Rotaria magnacalcarata TaxID=392030 RepID=A0A816M2Y6_9BILA|nr:unnamed protein product [Rotaria magnacalcarata]CAF5218479.1 unnamed protein product [Rotaria magnacalcarata]